MYPVSSKVFEIVAEGPCNAKDFKSLMISLKLLICFFTLSDKLLITSKFSIDFDREISILYARSLNETECFFPLSENYHENGILKYTIAPAILDQELEIKLKLTVKKFAKLLNLKGLLTIELFQRNNDFIFNEIAPRPHNSFHWTIEGCKNSQFDILVKSIMGQNINDQVVGEKWKMINLLGDEIENLKLVNFHKYQKIHVYGKKEIKNGRKMGHITYPI